MSQMVHAVVAGDVREAEEIQEILNGAGIESELQSGEEDSVVVLVQERESRRQRERHRLRRNVDDVAVLDVALRILLHLAVHAHAAVLQHLAKGRARGVGELSREMVEKRRHG